MSECSRNTLSIWGVCLVKSSCLPRASPRSARYHEVVAGMLSGLCENCRSVIMSAVPHRVSVLHETSLALKRKHPSPRPSPTRGEGNFPLLMGGIKGGWCIFVLFCEPLAHRGLPCKNFVFSGLKNILRFNIISFQHTLEILTLYFTLLCGVRYISTVFIQHVRDIFCIECIKRLLACFFIRLSK